MSRRNGIPRTLDVRNIEIGSVSSVSVTGSIRMIRLAGTKSWVGCPKREEFVFGAERESQDDIEPGRLFAAHSNAMKPFPAKHGRAQDEDSRPLTKLQDENAALRNSWYENVVPVIPRANESQKIDRFAAAPEGV